MDTTEQVPVDVLIKEIQRLETGSIEEHMSLMDGLGRYFYRVLPYEVNESLITFTAVMLNNLFVGFDENEHLPALQDSINNVLSVASSMAREINRGEYRSKEFDVNIKLLGKLLRDLPGDICDARIRR